MSQRRRRKRSGIGVWIAVLIALVLVLGKYLPKQDRTPASRPTGEVSVEDTESSSTESTQTSTGAFSYASVPAYTSFAYAEVNGNSPYFTADDLSAARQSYASYGDLDSLGRCTACIASLSKETMPTKTRGYIGSVRPTGWHTVKYAGIDGNYLYNRCHLIGYQLSGENANEKNLITGTRYLNVTGMLPFEDETADYLKNSGNHVLYRVTPVFQNNELVARGVLMEAESVEDNGAGLKFCVFCYNVQPGVTINYSDGTSTGPAFTGSGK